MAASQVIFFTNNNKIIIFNVQQNPMKKIAFILVLLAYTTCFAQSTIEGYIFDKTIKTPLPYATIKLISIEKYTISNEDGKFKIEGKFTNDSIEVTYIGFKSKKVPASYFIKSPKLYLDPIISDLEEVIVVADKDYAYNLLNSLIQKYHKKRSTTESKAFLSLTSSARNTPIEQIEGFYSSKQNLSNGIIDLKIKSGRFGQNKAFSFYSLDNTTILRDFKLFNNGSQILPLYPGNMTLSSIKRKYIVKVDDCNSCNGQEMLISFVPKKFNGRLFFGKILFNKEKLGIKKIELGIKDPITKGLSAITEKDVIIPKDIQLNIVFNPIDIDKIQYLDFSFKLNYDYGNTTEIIKSHSFLYFYDYNNSFEEPYFTKAIDFNNDYDKIIALQATDSFWDSNYQFPKSYNEKRSMNFMKKFGYLINYDNTIPTDYIKYIKPSVISWSKYNRLEWEIIKQDLETNNEISKDAKYSYGSTREVDKISHSISDLKNKKINSSASEKYNFSYLVDHHKNKNQFIIRTLFDRNSSYCIDTRSKNKLIYLNLIFDIYEYYRQGSEDQVTDKMTFEQVKEICKKQFEEASVTVEKMKNETNSGLNYQNLIRWNSKVKSKLDIDNFMLISNHK